MEENQSVFNFLSELGVDEISLISLSSILADSSKFYRKFHIPKRRGGLREILAPYPSLAAIQKVLLTSVIAKIPSHKYAFAYRKESNAIQHAEFHVDGDELLILDIKNFFPSITRQMVYQSLEKSGLCGKDCHLLSLVCSVSGVLPQGACTSPALSNIVFFPLDNRFEALAAALGLRYSRYADDLAFSGEYIVRNLPNIIRSILSSKGFSLNDSKTRLKIKGAKKILTGVSISSGVAKAPREYKRKLRAEIYELEKNVDNLGNMPILDPLIYERILGRLNYVLQIEPHNVYVLSKRQSLSLSHQQLLNSVR